MAWGILSCPASGFPPAAFSLLHPDHDTTDHLPSLERVGVIGGWRHTFSLHGAPKAEGAVERAQAEQAVSTRYWAPSYSHGVARGGAIPAYRILVLSCQHSSRRLWFSSV